MSLRQVLSDDLRRNIADNPTQFIFDGNTYTGEFSGITESKKLEIGGFDVEPTASILINLLDDAGNPIFQERPDLEDLITVNGRQLRIVRTETDPNEAALQLDLASPAL